MQTSLLRNYNSEKNNLISKKNNTEKNIIDQIVINSSKSFQEITKSGDFLANL